VVGQQNTDIAVTQQLRTFPWQPFFGFRWAIALVVW